MWVPSSNASWQEICSLYLHITSFSKGFGRFSATLIFWISLKPKIPVFVSSCTKCSKIVHLLRYKKKKKKKKKKNISNNSGFLVPSLTIFPYLCISEIASALISTELLWSIRIKFAKLMSFSTTLVDKTYPKIFFGLVPTLTPLPPPRAPPLVFHSRSDPFETDFNLHIVS